MSAVPLCVEKGGGGAPRPHEGPSGPTVGTGGQIEQLPVGRCTGVMHHTARGHGNTGNNEHVEMTAGGGGVSEPRHPLDGCPSPRRPGSVRREGEPSLPTPSVSPYWT